MRLLALDTATEALSVALYDDSGVVAHHFEIIGRGHAEQVLPLVRQLLEAAEWPLHTLDAIAVGRGPGAFTGVRIGVSAAQGLAFGLDVLVVGISDLEAVAVGARARAAAEGIDCDAVVVALDARMDEVYAALCPVSAAGLGLAWEVVCGPSALVERVGSVGRLLLAGHGFCAYPKLLQSFTGVVGAYPDQLPDAGVIAQLAAGRLQSGAAIAAESLEPVYLRNEVATRSNR
ncbi:MAG: tRNA (adenosine(37)-N6)-threonylcarbamoyltransferase complex dimerization subunit type 1 TsaB [Pseudomonadota bacterium]|jgi:tRNA threonylcarbamoyladenosine biosynthesis protein TsaB